MYIPPLNRVEDRKSVNAFIHAHGFATLITTDDDNLVSGGEDEPEPPHWYFELPRHGRTVVVRSLKTKKILHRVTWNGEKFVEEKK